MKDLIKKVLKESDLDYWKDYAERKKEGESQEKKSDDILQTLDDKTFIDDKYNIYAPWIRTRFSLEALKGGTHFLLAEAFIYYCMKKFKITEEEANKLWGNYLKKTILTRLLDGLSNINEEEEFDPFGHITEPKEEEYELEELGFDLNKDCVLGFSKNNAKLEWPYFSLPAGYTCPFATVCKNFPAKWEGPIKGGKFKRPASWDKNIKPGPQAEIMCYAARAQGQYPGANVQAFKNLDLLKKMKTKEKMANLIIKSMEYHGLANTDILRIHEAGDFFSQDYLDAWIEVAKRMPQTLFYAYTVSLPYYMARKNSLPKNFKMIASMDKNNEQFILDNGLRYSRVVGSEEEARELGLPIDVDDSIAWGSDDNFALVIHGSQPKGSEAAETLKQNRKSGLYDKIKQAKELNKQKKNTLRDKIRRELRNEDLEYWGVRGDKMGPLKEDDFSWAAGDSLNGVIFKTKDRPDLTYIIQDDDYSTVRVYKKDGEHVNNIVRDYVMRKFKSGEWYVINDKQINEEESENDEVTSLKGHRDYNDWVFIHRNLNRPPYYSIKAGKSGGPVIGYDTDIHLKDVIFKVQRGGQSRVRKEMRKNVHAGVVGKIKDSGGNYDTSGWTLVTYNPYQHDSFVEYETGRPIYKAKEAILKNEKEVWAKK